MTDYANELRRHAEKVGRPSGDVPAAMHAAAAHIENLEHRLREAEARAAELEVEREKQKPAAWEGAEQWEPLAMFLCADENGSDSCHEMVWEGYPPEPWGERWQKYESEARRMIDLTRYAFQPITAPVRLTDEDFARLYDDAGFDPNEMREAAKHMFDAIQSAVLRANGFDIQPARGEG